MSDTVVHYLIRVYRSREYTVVLMGLLVLVSIPTFDWSFQYLLYLPEVTGRYFFLFVW